MRTHPDTSADLRLRNVILLSNYVRRIVDTSRVHRFPIRHTGFACIVRTLLLQVATLCALDLQALDVCGQCVTLQPRFPADSKVLCDFLGVPLVCHDRRFGRRQRGRFPIR